MNFRETLKAERPKMSEAAASIIKLLNEYTPQERAKMLAGMLQCDERHEGPDAILVHHVGKKLAFVTLEQGWMQGSFMIRVEEELDDMHQKLMKIGERFSVLTNGLESLLGRTMALKIKDGKVEKLGSLSDLIDEIAGMDAPNEGKHGI